MEEKKGEGRETTWRGRWSMVLSRHVCVRVEQTDSMRHRRRQEALRCGGSGRISGTGLDRKWGREEGGISRQNQHHNRCLTGDPTSVRRVADFDGHDATTRAGPEAVGRRALPKPWLNFKLASGLWPASRCPHQPTKTPASSLSLNRSLAPITSLATVFG